MQVRFEIHARHDRWFADLLLRCGATARPLGTSAGNPWVGACLSDVGCVRATNEDRCAFIVPHDPVLFAAKGLLAVVADGMGGHQAGEVASSMAVDIVSRVYFEAAAAPRDALLEAFDVANREIYEAGQHAGRRGMGTTCTALAIVHRSVVWAHIGDSRLYHVRRGKLLQLTEDDSEVGSLIRSGWMSAGEARRHPQRNLLSRALGLDAEAKPSTPASSLVARWGDKYLLCSDGLHDVVEGQELESVLHQKVPAEACDHLVALARARGGPDNITAVIVGIH
jgi:serine/threonine protein phosphatase PrpC